MHERSLSLIVRKELADKVIQLSDALGLDFGEFIPHATLLWCGGVDYNHEIILRRGVEIVVSGFYCDVDAKDRVWVGLKVELTEEIIDLRSEYMQKHSMPSSSEPYFPHITLGCITEDDLGSLNLAPLAALSDINGSHLCDLQLCNNGEFGKVVGIVEV